MLNWHRKARKTTLAINQLIRWASLVRAPFWYVGPSYGLAKKTVWEDPRMLPIFVPTWNDAKNSIVRKWETELRIEFIQSGGQIYIFGSDRPDLMRGPNPQGVVLDEYSVMRPEVWNEIIQPVMRSNPTAWCWFLFTPKGKNHAFQAFQRGLRGDKEWKSWKMDILESGIFTQEQIENAKKDSPELAFRQEYLCEFIEGAGAIFRGVGQVMTEKEERPIRDHLYVIGIDLGKTEDFTVISVFDRKTNKQVYRARFQDLEWPFQKSKIQAISMMYNKALCAIDATGLGDPIADDLVRAGVPIEPFKFTQSSKKELIEKLSIWIEQKLVNLIGSNEALMEYEMYSYEIGLTGNVRYGAPQGFHDDIVTADALGVYLLHPLSKVVQLPQKTPVQQMYEKVIKDRQYSEEGELNSW